MTLSYQCLAERTDIDVPMDTWCMVPTQADPSMNIELAHIFLRQLNPYWV